MSEQDCLDFCYERGIHWEEDGVELYSVIDVVSCWCCKIKILNNKKYTFICPVMIKILEEYMKETNIERVRKSTIILAKSVDLIPDDKFGFIMQHPFTNSIMVPNFEESLGFLNLLEEDDKKTWIRGLVKYLNQCSINDILCILNHPWCLTWFDIIHDYLSDKDFAELLVHSWVTEENPNMDVNVSLSKIIEWFKTADKQYLMTKDELEYYNNLPDELVLYRGVSIGRTDIGLSWTDDKEKAEWFEHRFENWKNEGNQRGHLLTIT